MILQASRPRLDRDASPSDCLLTLLAPQPSCGWLYARSSATEYADPGCVKCHSTPGLGADNLIITYSPDRLYKTALADATAREGRGSAARWSAKLGPEDRRTPTELSQSRLWSVAVGRRLRTPVRKRSAWVGSGGRLKNVAPLATLALFGSHWELVTFPCGSKAARAIKGVYGHGEVGRDSASGQNRGA